MGVDRQTFYGHPAIGVAAMAFCFPGTNPRGGDYPPPPRCAALWRDRLLAELPRVELTLVVGGHAQQWQWPDARRSMTETVMRWRDGLPTRLALPHPSWRNTAWLKRNPWFEDEVTPYLRQRVAALLAA
jgi:uracil-DNA glycosylase